MGRFRSRAGPVGGYPIPAYRLALAAPREGAILFHPRVIVAHSSALNWEDGALTPRLHKALAEIYPAAEVLIVISPAGEVDVPQAVWSVVLDEDAVQPRLDTDALSVTAATAAQGVERILGSAG